METRKHAHVHIKQPYEPKISVNRAYYGGSQRHKKLPEVEAWLWHFRVAVREAAGSYGPPLGKVRMDLAVYVPQQRGRLFDTSNARKLIQDVAAAALEVDDARFGGTDYPTERSDDPHFSVLLSWEYDPTQPWGFQNKSLPKYQPREDSQLYYGPLNKTMLRLLGLEEGDVCIGYGSAYCIQCGENLRSIPCVNFHPSVYDECPCKTCELSCPCKENPPERVAKIQLWWESRVKSIKFQRENWE